MSLDFLYDTITHQKYPIINDVSRMDAIKQTVQTLLLPKDVKERIQQAKRGKKYDSSINLLLRALHLQAPVSREEAEKWRSRWRKKLQQLEAARPDFYPGCHDQEDLHSQIAAAYEPLVTQYVDGFIRQGIASSPSPSEQLSQRHRAHAIRLLLRAITDRVKQLEKTPRAAQQVCTAASGGIQDLLLPLPSTPQAPGH